VSKCPTLLKLAVVAVDVVCHVRVAYTHRPQPEHTRIRQGTHLR